MSITIEYQGARIDSDRVDRMVRRILIEEGKYIKSKNKPARKKMVETICKVIEEEEKCF